MARSRHDPRGRTADRPTEIPRRGWMDVGRRVKDEMAADNISIVAAGVAFFTLLSIFPALAAALTLYGIVASPEQVATQIQPLSGVLPGDVQRIIGDQLQRLASASGGALGFSAVVGLLASLWSASKGMKAMVGGMDIAYDETDDRGFVKLTATVLALTVGAVVFFLVSLVLIAAVPALAGSLGLPDALRTLVSWGRWPLLLVLVMLALAVLYRFAPDRDPPRWRWVTPGSLIAAVLWLVGSVAFSIYVRSFGSYNESYGALAGVVVLLMWLYISAYVVLLGAEVNAELERQTRKDSTKGRPEKLGRRGAHAADTVGR
ncbi:YihY/virulence factor BrkB family protein [Caenispirillum bisanense]|uniref:Membrane protein n=1 Tax=Caenispirillum bisanense TaxID=414052 RepID=A0A286G6G9_9PROT|nr:YihY/virulence factor BrkB family protein [Caenispirillum bisanense]SOD91095.1 membrane protein [Caenispirillum bisanense]